MRFEFGDLLWALRAQHRRTLPKLTSRLEVNGGYPFLISEEGAQRKGQWSTPNPAEGLISHRGHSLELIRSAIAKAAMYRTPLIVEYEAMNA